MQNTQILKNSSLNTHKMPNFSVKTLYTLLKKILYTVWLTSLANPDNWESEGKKFGDV